MIGWLSLFCLFICARALFTESKRCYFNPAALDQCSQRGPNVVKAVKALNEDISGAWRH